MDKWQSVSDCDEYDERVCVCVCVCVCKFVCDNMEGSKQRTLSYVIDRGTIKASVTRPSNTASTITPSSPGRGLSTFPGRHKQNYNKK